MTVQVKSVTMQALKTALPRINGQDWIARPRVRFNIAAVGKTPANVAIAIFHFGSGRKGVPGRVNQLSSPQSSSARPAPSEELCGLESWFTLPGTPLRPVHRVPQFDPR